MKRKLLFLGAALVAVTASFAFTANTKGPTYAYYYANGTLCEYGMIDPAVDCNITWTGPACTIYDGLTGNYVQAYLNWGSEYVCERPLYQFGD